MENGNAGNQGRERAVEASSDFERSVEGERTAETTREDDIERVSLSPEKAALERLGQMNTEEMTPVTLVMPSDNDSAFVDTGTVDDANPMTAEDSDKMEKAWAERIQKIIALTKDNPRVEQIEVNKLKADYLKKRFNREIGDRN